MILSHHSFSQVEKEKFQHKKTNSYGFIGVKATTKVFDNSLSNEYDLVIGHSKTEKGLYYISLKAKGQKAFTSYELRFKGLRKVDGDFHRLYTDTDQSVQVLSRTNLQESATNGKLTSICIKGPHQTINLYGNSL